MKTMKKFWKYFINFLVLMILVWAGTYFAIRGYTKEVDKSIECVIEEESPIIQVTETTNKKIAGTVTNDSKVLINQIYVKAEFYNKNGKLMGTKYDIIRYFNVGEKTKFKIEYGYANVTTVKLSTVDKLD